MGILRLTKRAISVWSVLKNARPQDFGKYTHHFSELSFMRKVKRVGQLLGDTLLLPILKLYFIMRSPDVPKTQKFYILGALGYFILPIDLLPDFLPGLVGFSDDLIVAGIILRQVSKFDSPIIQAKAENLIRKLYSIRL